MKSDIAYYLPNRKKPIAYSTIFTAKLLVILSEISNSIYSVYRTVYRSQEAKNVLEKYINKGYGQERASNFFNNQIFLQNYIPLFFQPGEEYSILLANSPLINTIEKVKEIIEFHWECGKREWKWKVPFCDFLYYLFGIRVIIDKKELEEFDNEEREEVYGELRTYGR